MLWIRRIVYERWTSLTTMALYDYDNNLGLRVRICIMRREIDLFVSSGHHFYDFNKITCEERYGHCVSLALLLYY